MSMNRVLVTGGGGFIGQSLVRALVARNTEVVVLGRHPYPELQAIGVTCLQGDIRDAAAVDAAVRGCNTVFHVAAKAGIWGPRQEYFDINTRGTTNVLVACWHWNVPTLVYTSTPSVVFDRHDIAGGDESLPYASKPLCHYAASKIQAEQAVLAANSENLRTVAIRPHLVWGPGDRNLIPRLLERGRTKQLKIVGSGTNRVDITYIDNVVYAHLLAAENLQISGTAAGQAFFVGQQEPVVLWNWINALFERVGIAPVTCRVPFSLAYAAGAVMEAAYTALRKDEEPHMTRFVAHQLARSHWFSHKRLHEVLGYREQVSTQQGVEQLVNWLGCSQKI